MRRRLERVLAVPMALWFCACTSAGDAAPPVLAAGGGGTGPVAPDPPDMSVVDAPGSGGAPITPGGAGGDRSPVPVVLDAGAGVDAGTSADAAAPAPSLDDAGVVDGGRTPADPSLGRLAALSERLAPLAERTVAFWVEHGPDATFGGFHGTLDRLGNPVPTDNKGLVQQARHLWMLSTWFERRDPSPEIQALAERQYDFLVEHFLDAADGAFVLTVSRDGGRVVDARKQLFAESYALYALSTYGRVFDAPEALELAIERFESIDTSRHDAELGGYDQRNDPGFMSPGAEKDANTHLHLMEAFTALYEATGDELVGVRLAEVTELMASTLRQGSGYVHAEFLRDWTPFGAARVSYGHDLETAWLMLEAARVLGRAGDAVLRAAAAQIAEHSAARGFDPARGGFFEAGVPAGAVTDFDKVWWVQFEALAGSWWAYALGGGDVHLDRMERTLDWLEASEDAPAGEWFAITDANGSAAGSDYKGDEWKASYHSVRALVFVRDWLDTERALR